MRRRPVAASVIYSHHESMDREVVLHIYRSLP